MNVDTSYRAGRVGSQRLSSGRMSSVGGGSFRLRHSRSSSGRVAPEVLDDDDDVDSEVVSQAGDTGELHSSRRYSGSTARSSVENFLSVEDGIVPVSDAHYIQTLPVHDGQYIQTFGAFSRGVNVLNTASPAVATLPPQMVSPLSTDPPIYIRNNDPCAPPQVPRKHFEEFEKDIPKVLEYISCLVHLAVFGILGVFTRYLLQKLFGPQVAGITSDQTFVYLDLPSNMVGSFLMGWLGVVFKRDISHVSDLLAIGLTTGYLGSLTTFSGWNQKMLDLCVNGRWVDAVLGITLGLWLSAESIRQGIETAKGFKWLLRRSFTWFKGDTSSPRNNFRVDNLMRHMVVLIVLLLTLGLLWSLSGVLFKKWHDGGDTNGQLWLACIVGPFGVWMRWFLARLNGRGIGRKGSLKWIPFGTLFANVLAACVMASLATVKKVVNTEKFDTYATGFQFGFLGCLSTVSTFIAEYHAMRESRYPWRANVYASITVIPSLILGTLIYSVPVWTKGYN